MHKYVQAGDQHGSAPGGLVAETRRPLRSTFLIETLERDYQVYKELDLMAVRIHDAHGTLSSPRNHADDRRQAACLSEVRGGQDVARRESEPRVVDGVDA